MHRHLIALAALTSIVLTPWVLAIEDIVPVSSLAHMHGIAFAADPSDGLILATHQGVFLLDAQGQARHLSRTDDFMGFAHIEGARFVASGHPAAGGNLGVLLSENGGKDWTVISDGAGGPVDFHAMSVSPADTMTIYGLFGDIQVSRDAGRTWNKTGSAPTGTIDLAAAPDAAGSIFAGTQSGLMFSGDFGANWTLSGPQGVPATAVEASAAGDVYAFLVGAGLFKRDTRGKWSALAASFDERLMLHIALDPVNPGHMAAVFDDGAIMTSNDGGMTWQAIGQ
jgi:photosystem II stability/assembly factor-like uncharacterized protein